MTADPGDDNFIAILLGSLPESYDPYLAALTATSALLNQTIDPDTYIRGIGDEADRRGIKNRAKEEKEAAYNANGGSAGHGRRGKRSSTVECYNCHKKGHIKAECWAKGGGKEGQGLKGKEKGTTANKAADDDDGVWYARADSSDGDSELDDWRDLAEMNLGGYNEPWYEYAHEGGAEKLEGLAGTYLHDEVAQPYAEDACDAAATAEPISDPGDDGNSDAGSMPSLQTVSDSNWSDDDIPALMTVSNSSDDGEDAARDADTADAEVFSEYDPGEEIPDLDEWCLATHDAVPSPIIQLYRNTTEIDYRRRQGQVRSHRQGRHARIPPGEGRHEDALLARRHVIVSQQNRHSWLPDPIPRDGVSHLRWEGQNSGKGADERRTLSNGN
ncbi:hypothetical protein GGX14DRAFT_485497 [Mycena pura]|uniref:CCHC-type domain-containing protein n=1 Tax=Mycena pura TaxID=153505 RepID=A0AAD6ULI3_9AGAR|nr:hypothetical protein GGX14DRAFT_485497 [Mycena pura]